MHFGPWEFVAFGSLWIAAFMLAADVGLRMAPTIRDRVPSLQKIQETGWWAFIPLVLLTLAGAVFLYRSLGELPELDHATGGSPVVKLATLALAIVFGLIVLMRFLQKRRDRSSGGTAQAGKETSISSFSPRSQMIPLTEVEFTTSKLGQAAPWLELYVTAYNATGYSIRTTGSTGRVIVSGQEFHGHIELMDSIKTYGDDRFFRLGLKIPVSNSEADYCINALASGNMYVDFPGTAVEFQIHTLGASMALRVPFPKRLHFNAVSGRTDPYLPWQIIGR